MSQSRKKPWMVGAHICFCSHLYALGFRGFVKGFLQQNEIPELPLPLLFCHTHANISRHKVKKSISEARRHILKLNDTKIIWCFRFLAPLSPVGAIENWALALYNSEKKYSFPCYKLRRLQNIFEKYRSSSIFLSSSLWQVERISFPLLKCSGILNSGHTFYSLCSWRHNF